MITIVIFQYPAITACMYDLDRDKYGQKEFINERSDILSRYIYFSRPSDDG